MGSSLTDSREAMVNTVVDVFGAYNSAVSRMSRTSSILSPITSMRLLPLYVLGMLKHVSCLTCISNSRTDYYS